MRVAVFDTNIVIDALNGVQAANEEYQQYEVVLISLVTWMEVMVGTTEETKQLTRTFLNESFIHYPITRSIVEEAVIIRQQRRIKLPDAIILATAQVNQAILVTRNTRDFPEDSHLIRIPYKI